MFCFGKVMCLWRFDRKILHKDVKVFKNYVKSNGEENADIMRNAWKERGEI